MWHGVERLPGRMVEPVADPRGLSAVFTDAVRDLTREADTIGVAVSGGLDSLATLVHACAVAEGRRVIAFTVDLTDDRGRSCVAVVRRLVRDLALPVQVEVVDGRARAVPLWSPLGPRLDALPELNAAVAERAASRGAGVLLSGDGADEALGVPRFAARAVAAVHGVTGAARYLRDAARSDPGLAGEAASAVASLLLPRQRAEVYWAVNWPDWCVPTAPAVLAEPYRTRATLWARRWVAQAVADHAAAGRSWAQADALDAFYPHEVIRPAGAVAEGSPFLTEGFLRAAFALPLGARYGPRLPTPYWRSKALVLSLLPRDRWKALPARKQYVRSALAQTAARFDPLAVPLAIDAGLIEPDQLARETDTAVLLAVHAIERWLHGAIEKGAHLR
ncbi:asparagine synthase-related protein [Streptomyces cinereoruber]|uniref:asparagine synthase-related protein n=1 Tax=Streptomyces cinereoruber TaxID=67260 RepID=UPI0036B4E705